MADVSVVSNHITVRLSYGERKTLLAVQHQGWQKQKTKSWQGTHEVENETSYLDMKIQSQTHQKRLLDDKSREES